MGRQSLSNQLECCQSLFIEIIYASELTRCSKPLTRDVFHWLPVPQKIQLEIATLTCNCVRRTEPANFSSIACTVANNWGRPGLRSAERGYLLVPWTRTTRLVGWSFFIAAPVTWNSLPLHIIPRPSVTGTAQD